MLANVSIKVKLIAAFATVLVCTIGLGMFAVQRLDSVNAAAAEMRQQVVPTTRVLGELAYHTMRLRQLEATDALAPDATARAAEENTMRNVAAQVQKAFATYDPYVDSGEERQLADAM